MKIRIVEDPSPEAWNRVRHYASWMRQVCVDQRSDLVEDTFRKFRLSSPPNGWFPALQDLSWRITYSNIFYISIFISPHLKKISIYAPGTWASFTVPANILAAVASTVSTLPGSALQSLSIGLHCRAPPGYFKDSLSSIVLRCGPSLTEFTTTVPLSDAAANHLSQLPHLRTLHIGGTPPTYSALSSPPIFPHLTELTFGTDAACGWLSLFQHLENSVPTMQGTTLLSELRKSLKSLNVDDHSRPIIDVSFTSPIQMFQNLAVLDVAVSCPGYAAKGRCIFRLNNGNVAKLAMALPQLGTLSLGPPCADNTCATTVACLLPISVHCLKLRELQIHFNTTTIVDDLKEISKDPWCQELHSLPRCRSLSKLYAEWMPLTLDESGFETVVDGIINIFPSLEYCVGRGRPWEELSERITEFRRMSTLSAHCR